MKTEIWIHALRLRTLPLASASIILGSFLAAANGAFKLYIALFCFLTAIFLQILSNLANDYGDAIHGADNESRIGPKRATHSGIISKSAMRNAIILFTALCLIAGYILIQGESIIYYLLGIAAILAAVAYTAGPKPYGYAGLGDCFVFIFFGIVGVFGTYYLHTHRLDWEILLPSISCGLFSVAVLNINNIRDMRSDKLAGKITIPVRIGKQRANLYHWSLLLTAMVCALIYVILNFTSSWQLLFFLLFPLILNNGKKTAARHGFELDPLLKQMSIITLLFSLTFGLGNLF